MILPHLRQWDALAASETTPTDNSQDSSAAGVEVLSAWNRGLLLATIALFLALSVISGRVLWKQSRRPRTSNAAASGANANGANGSNSKGGGLYSTPNNGGASGHNSFSGLPPSVAAAGGGAVASSSTGLLDDESSATLSTGAEMRQRFFLLLFVASTIRVLSLVTEVTTLSLVAAMPSTSLYARLLTMFLWLPSLLFVTMYGLVLLFVAQLCYACWGKAYPWPRRLFFVFNVALYVAFFVLFAVSATAAGYWKACDLVLGSVYFLGLFGILYYSVRLIYFFRNQSPDEDFFFDLPSSAANPRQVVLRRITAVCILLCVLFAIKAVYLMGMGSGLMASEEANYRSPVGVHHIAYEFTMHFTTEFVPGALLIFFTRQSNKPASSELVRAMSPATTTLGSSGASGQLNASTSTSTSSSGHLKPMTPSYAFRVRNSSQNNSSQSVASHHGYPEDNAPMLSGYQYQATQRAYGTANVSSSSSNLRGSNNTGAYLLEPLAGGGFPTSTGLNLNQGTTHSTASNANNY
uniref:THH1/TOM1/TOM3 domain-containing protein n=1 Tax=Globisporangium ultimum (strain ATCC 200006 / CBS 805.95 / DAOM BR144) TaxID=431595 RepID=K3X7Y2_GLOUD